MVFLPYDQIIPVKFGTAGVKTLFWAHVMKVFMEMIIFSVKSIIFVVNIFNFPLFCK